MNVRRAAVVAHSSVRGGAESYLRSLYDTTGSRDELFVGDVFGSQPDWPSFADLGLSPKWGGGRSMITGRLKLPAERRRLSQALRNEDLDYAHMQFKREQIGFTSLVAKSMPVVWTEHGVMPKKTRMLLGRDYARAASHASVIICVSQEVAEFVVALNPTARVEVIENSVDTVRHQPPTADQRAEARDFLGIDEHEPLAVWVGRLDENKRPDLAAEIGYAWGGSLIIAGDGAYRSRLVDKDGVRALGHVAPEPLYRAADALLMTSNGRGEGMPYVVLEAAAYGIPSIVSGDVLLLRRLAGESGGVSVDESQIDAWCAGLDEAVRNTERRVRAREWAQAHDVEVWRRRHYDVINGVL